MPITYPKFFEELLQRDRSLRVAVDNMAVAFDGWLNSSRLPFFTDYTDHGIDHLNCVLATANHLISDKARDILTPSDVAVLVASILLHDSAMHLSEAGFYSLIRGEASDWNNPGFSDRPWPVLWDEFLFSAKRWDEQRLRDVLGETPSGEPRAQVRDPFTNYEDLSDTDRKLIGEFIRQHHPRMAHEFALYGVPGRVLVKPGRLFPADLRDISGLVARSHGLPVRACLEYLHERYHKREYKNLHAVFLMTLLRVSDYLQIQAERAPAIVFQYRHIPSKFSELEWKAHHAISNITQTHDDPESIEIQAHPDDVPTYLRLNEWLSGIQEELDASWAVLGETYGSQPKLRDLGLILRRVRSNLDHMDAFSRQVGYVPERIELTVARPDLLKLLVGPLYDNIPSIGIRELMQNAVDAVREREFLQRKHPDLCNVPLIDQDNDVEIWLEDPDESGYSWLTVSDRGTGMTVEIIKDYFLTAGASFRNSDAWKREFEMDDMPHSSVLRSGRFGVGVLAGFLLGSRMEVVTRHIRSKLGIRFSMTLDLNVIELKWDPISWIGTVIRIQISQNVRRKLLESAPRVSIPRKYDWFIYNHPSVARFVGQERKGLEQVFCVDQPDPKRPSSLRLLRASYNYSVYWTYQPLPNLSVNGLFVTNSRTRRGYLKDSSNDGVDFNISYPQICIEDPDGAFPLNLRRSDITEREYPFESELLNDIIDDFLAYLIVNCPEDPSDKRLMFIDQHPGVRFKTSWSASRFHRKSILEGAFDAHLSPILFNNYGITLFSPRQYENITNHTVFVVPASLPADVINPSQCVNSVFTIVQAFETDPWRTWPEEALQNEIFRYDTPFIPVLESAYSLRTAETEASKLLIGNRLFTGLRLLLPTRLARKVEKPNQWIGQLKRNYEKAKKKAKKEQLRLRIVMDELEYFISMICDTLKIERSIGDYSFMATPGCPATQISSPDLKKSQKEIWTLEICSIPGNPSDSPGLITERWNQIIRRPFIPFNPTVRRRELKHAYKALKPFILSHEAMKREGVLY